MADATLKIRRAKENDIDVMLRLFSSYIDNSFFAKLGNAFLKLLLQELIRSDLCITLVCSIDSRVIAFLSGTSDCPRCFRRIVSRRGLPLFLLALKGIFRIPATLQIIKESLIYISRAARDSAKAELLFIAIEPDYRMRGVATGLITAALAELKKRGICKVRVSTDQANLAINALLQKLNFELTGSSLFINKGMYLYKRQI